MKYLALTLCAILPTCQPKPAPVIVAPTGPATALLGDEHLGVPGVVKTQGNHEARIRRIEKWAVYVFGVGGGLIIAWKFLSAASPAIGAFLSGK